MNVIPIDSAREIADPIQQVFTHWQIIMSKSRARLDEKRRKCIKARFADGYEVQDLLDAINGCYLSPFHMGENPDGTIYNELSLICRDAEHIDRFIETFEEGQKRLARIQEVQEKPEAQISTAEFARAQLDRIKKMMRR